MLQCLDGREAASVVTSVYLCVWCWLGIVHSSHQPHPLAALNTGPALASHKLNPRHKQGPRVSYFHCKSVFKGEGYF